MKKVIAIITMFILSVSVITAQSTPDGINYQAVARNLKGEILAKQPVSLKVSLFKVNNNQRVEYYREIQQVTTSTVGVFSVALGKGQAEFGQFVDVPWSTENIWMEISIKSKGDADYTSISSNKLLAVPYAFHSITAERLANGSGNVSNATTTTTNGTPSNSWLVFSNRSSNPNTDRLGTGDSTDLNIATNYVPRIIVKADGRTQFIKTATFKDTVYAEKSVRLNTVSGNTINYGNFTVDRKSATALTGTLKVDSSTQLQQTLRVGGVTDLMSNLNVNNLSPTFLSGTLKVDGVTDLNNNLNVNNKKSTVLTGTLTVDSPSIFKSYVKLTNSALDQDTAGGGANAIPTGALQVAGGGHFSGNVVIKKNLKIGGELASGVLIATSDSESVDTKTGALRVKGGAGITRNVNIGGAVKIDSTLIVKSDVTLNSTTPSVDESTGALVVKGGVGIDGVLNLTANEEYVANFKNTSGKNGITIQINNEVETDARSYVNNSNHFVEFKNKNGEVVGCIQGETYNEMLTTNDDYIFEKSCYDVDIEQAEIDVILSSIDLSLAAADLIGAIAGTPFSFGDFVGAAAGAIAGGISLGYTVDARRKLKERFNTWKTNAASGVGVSYQSGGADYAEYLNKSNIQEVFHPGDIVGVKGGFISKNTTGAERLMVISNNPIILGNVQEKNKSNYEKVAFLGQVPVRVTGKVNIGDYIITNGLNNGVGKAVSPNQMKLENIKNIVGIAWSSSDNSGLGIDKINVAVGLNQNDLHGLVQNLENKVTNLESQLAATNAKLDKLISALTNGNSISNKELTSQSSDLKSDINTMSKVNNQFPVLTDEEFCKIFNVVSSTFENKSDVNNSPELYEFALKQLKDESFRTKMATKIRSSYEDLKIKWAEINCK
jgi:hypothetical protein